MSSSALQVTASVSQVYCVVPVPSHNTSATGQDQGMGWMESGGEEHETLGFVWQEVGQGEKQWWNWTHPSLRIISLTQSLWLVEDFLYSLFSSTTDLPYWLIALALRQIRWHFLFLHSNLMLLVAYRSGLAGLFYYTIVPLACSESYNTRWFLIKILKGDFWSKY